MKFIFFIYLQILFFLKFSNSLYFCDSTFDERQIIYNTSLSNLQKNFKITKGDFIFTNKTFGNPAGTYGVFKFDHLPYALEYKIQNLSSFFNLNITSTIIGKQDALVLYMCTPPFGDYFSFVNYVLARFNGSNFWLPATPLNDPINNLIMNTSSREPYNSSVLFISTGDYKTFNQIKKSFINNGVSPNAINFLPIPTDLFKFKSDFLPWIINKSDLINYHFRISSYDHYNPIMIEYLNYTWPFYFLKFNKKIVKKDPVYSLPLRNRKSNNSQLFLQDNLYELVSKTIQNYSSILKVKHIFHLNHIVPDYNQCLNNNSFYPIVPNLSNFGFKLIPGFCDFFVRDALYSLYPNIYSSLNITNDLYFSNNTFVIFGVNQVYMNQSIYSNLLLTIARAPETIEHTSNLTSNDLIKSTNQNEFYKYAWTRNCSIFGKYCRQFTYDEINENNLIFIAERKYLNPITKIGPDPNELLEPIVIVFENI